MGCDSDFAHLAIVYCLNGAAIAVNVLLIGIIVLRTPPSMRSYAVILFHNALIDLFSAFASAMAATRVIYMHDLTAVMVFLGQCSMLGGMSLCFTFQSEHIEFYLTALLSLEKRALTATHQTLITHSIAILLISFCYRLHVLQHSSVTIGSPLKVWQLCSLSYIPACIAWYLTYITAHSTPDSVLEQLHLNRYVTAWFTLADVSCLLSVMFIIVFSPSVMVIVFVVRRRLLNRIAKSSVAHQAQHKHIAQALTYQLLLPCGQVAASTFWILDVAGVYSAEWPQRLIMVSSSLYALVSPLINLLYLPPYRRFFIRTKKISTYPMMNRNGNIQDNEVVM